MNQKQFVFLLLGLIIIAVIVLGISKFTQSSQSVAPSPSGLFDNQAQQAAAQPASSTTGIRRQYSSPPPILPPDQLQNKEAVIHTAKGNIVFQIYPEASMAASNFIFLANNHFYNGLTFHRVVPGFVIQGGDPNGNGTGGPGYQFNDEPVTKPYVTGTVAMANSGPNTNGSQFFIVLADQPTLPPAYTIFGQVISGQNVVNSIKVGDVMQKVTIQPLQK